MLLFSKAAIVAAVGLCSLVLAPSAYAQNCPYVGQGTYSHNMSPTLTSPSAGQTFNVPYGSRADVQFQGAAKLTSSLDQIMSADCVRQAYKPQLLLQVDGIDTAFIDWDYVTGKWAASAKIHPGQHKIRSKAVTYLKPTDPGVFYSSEISINVVQGQPPSTVIGTIDGVEIDTSPYGNGKAVLVGWACDRNVARSIDVHVYLGGAAGQGTFGVVGNTNVLRPAVSATCGTSNVAHGFRIDLTTLQQQFAGKPIYVHGISTSGGYNPTLAASGQYNVPAVPALGIKGNVDGFSLVNGRLYLKVGHATEMWLNPWMSICLREGRRGWAHLLSQGGPIFLVKRPLVRHVGLPVWHMVSISTLRHLRLRLAGSRSMCTESLLPEAITHLSRVRESNFHGNV